MRRRLTPGRAAAALRAAPGRFAALVGAGVSDSAGITTGEDLIRSAGTVTGADPGAHAVAWYQERAGRPPDYFDLVTGADRAAPALPATYVPAGARPTPAHHALATLAVTGLVRVFLTTNLDPLLERAITAAGVEVRVAADLRTIDRVAAGAASWTGGARCLVAKIHGDCRDIRIRHTSPGPDRYHPVIDRLLDTVLSSHDLLVAGWSAAWDVALCAALARPANRRRTYWLLRGEPSAAAAAVIAARRAVVVPVSDSDAGLRAVVRAALEPPGTGGDPPPTGSPAASATRSAFQPMTPFLGGI